MLAEAGAQLVALHGRHKGSADKRRDGAADLSYVRAVADALTVTVICWTMTVMTITSWATTAPRHAPSTQAQLYTCKLLEGGEDKEMAMTIEEMIARTATTI